MAKNPSTLLLSLAEQSSAMLGRASLTAGYAGATRRPGAALTRGSLGRKVAWRTIQVDIPRASDTESTADISKPTASQAARRQDEHLPCVDGEQVVKRFFEALNKRDISACLELTSPEVVLQDLAHETPAMSQMGVAKFYSDLVSSMADNMCFVIEDMTVGDPYRVGVTWHLEVRGVEVPCSRGLSFYRLNDQGQITHVRQSPEHWLKMAGLAQGMSGLIGAPIVNSLGPAALPTFWQRIADVAGAAIASQTQAAGYSNDGSSPADFLGGLFGAPPGPPAMSAPSQPVATRHIQSQVRGSQQGMHTHDTGSVPSTAALHCTRESGPSGMAPSSAAKVSPVNDTQQASSASTRSGDCPADNRAKVGRGALSNVVPIRRSRSRSKSRGRGEAALLEAGKGQDSISVLHMAVPAPTTGVADLAGLWGKDAISSDLAAYDRALDLWQISGAQKATARLIEGMDIHVQGDKFSVNFLTIVPMFKVTESYDFKRAVPVMRRDLRSGKATAQAHITKTGVAIHAHWSAPLAGHLEEHYELREPGCLHVTSTICVGDRCETACQVYRRQAGVSKEDFLKQSEKRNGRPHDILRRFGMPV